MDAIRRELDGIDEKIARLEAKRDAPGISEAMYALHTNEIIALQNRAGGLATMAAAQFPAGMMIFSQINYLPMPLMNHPHLLHINELFAGTSPTLR